MPTWNPSQYLRFSRERTQPSHDLAARIEPADSLRVLDLGCGPGNSTAVLAEHLPGARIVGADNDPHMLARARADHPELDFLELDATGDLSPHAGCYDVVFSNACLQWVPDHRTLVPRLMDLLAPHGQLAVQIPLMYEQVLYREVIGPLVRSGTWPELAGFDNPGHVLPKRDYLQILSGCSEDYDIWQTTYWHRLPNHEAVLEWYRGSSLRGYLERLDERRQDEFLASVRRCIGKAYPLEPTGEVVLEFPRLFWLARKA